MAKESILLLRPPTQQMINILLECQHVFPFLLSLQNETKCDFAREYFMANTPKRQLRDIMHTMNEEVPTKISILLIYPVSSPLQD